MATEYTLIAGAQSTVADTIEIFYGPAIGATKINKFTATNDTGVNRSYRVFIYDSAGVALGSIIPTKFVTALRGFDEGPSIVGQIVPIGGTIRIESSFAAGLVFRAVGALTSS